MERNDEIVLKIEEKNFVITNLEILIYLKCYHLSKIIDELKNNTF